MNIKVRFERDEDGICVATCPSLPGCISQGKTENEALKNIGSSPKSVVIHRKFIANLALQI